MVVSEGDGWFSGSDTKPDLPSGVGEGELHHRSTSIRVRNSAITQPNNAPRN